MTMRSYDDVEFRPWYVPDTARWLKLSLAARGLVAELLRKLDRHGRISLGDDPAADLAIILRVAEADVRGALPELLSAGRLVWDAPTRILFDPDFANRMRMGSAARMAKKRAKDAAIAASTALPSNDVTPVTSRHGASPSPSDLDLISSGSSLESRSEDPSVHRARDPGELPEWAPGAFDTVEMSTGETFDRPTVWLAYQGSREADHRPTNAPDLRRYLASWAARQKGQRVNQRARADVEPADNPETRSRQDAYARGISAGKGLPWVWPDDRGADKALGRLIAGHAKDDAGKAYSGAQLLRWIEHTAKVFAADVVEQGRAEYFSAFAPAGCVRWLNEQHQTEEARNVG